MTTLFSYTSPFEERYLLNIRTESYGDGSVRIQLYDSADGTPYATATTRVEEKLDQGEVAIKNWSENEGILNLLVENKIVQEPHRFASSGYVMVPICKLI